MITLRDASGYNENVTHTPVISPIMSEEKMNQSVLMTAYTTQPTWFRTIAA